MHLVVFITFSNILVKKIIISYNIKERKRGINIAKFRYKLCYQEMDFLIYRVNKYEEEYIII